MKKNLFMLFVVLMTACIFVSCSKDDDDAGAGSTLTMNGEAVKIKSLEGEYDPSTSFKAFSFWVNDASSAAGGVYLQGDLSVKLESLEVGKDLTKSFGMLLQFKGGDEYVTDGSRSGSLVVQSIDTSKKVLVLEFRNLKFVSNLKNEVLLNGTLAIPYQIVEYGSEN